MQAISNNNITNLTVNQTIGTNVTVQVDADSFIATILEHCTNNDLKMAYLQAKNIPVSQRYQYKTSDSPKHPKSKEVIQHSELPSFFGSTADAQQYLNGNAISSLSNKTVGFIDSSILYDLLIHGADYDRSFQDTDLFATETLLAETGAQPSLLHSIGIKVLNSPLTPERKAAEAKSHFPGIALQGNDGNDFLLCLEAHATLVAMQYSSTNVQGKFFTRNMKCMQKCQHHFGIKFVNLNQEFLRQRVSTPADMVKAKQAIRCAKSARHLLSCYDLAYQGKTTKQPVFATFAATNAAVMEFGTEQSRKRKGQFAGEQSGNAAKKQRRRK